MNHLEFLHIVVGMQNGTAALKNYLVVSYKVNLWLSYNPAIPLLEIHPREMKSVHTRKPFGEREQQLYLSSVKIGNSNLLHLVNGWTCTFIQWITTHQLKGPNYGYIQQHESTSNDDAKWEKWAQNLHITCDFSYRSLFKTQNSSKENRPVVARGLGSTENFLGAVEKFYTSCWWVRENTPLPKLIQLHT